MISHKSKRTWIVLSAVLCAFVLAGLGYRHHRSQLVITSQRAGSYCDRGIGGAKARAFLKALGSMNNAAGSLDVNYGRRRRGVSAA